MSPLPKQSWRKSNLQPPYYWGSLLRSHISQPGYRPLIGTAVEGWRFHTSPIDIEINVKSMSYGDPRVRSTKICCHAFDQLEDWGMNWDRVHNFGIWGLHSGRRILILDIGVGHEASSNTSLDVSSALNPGVLDMNSLQRSVPYSDATRLAANSRLVA